MPNLVRLSFSLEEPLLRKLDELQAKSQYTNRSELIRDMIRERLVQNEWQEDQEAVGTVTLVYDHHLPRLSHKLTHTQHDFHDLVMAATQNYFESRLGPNAPEVSRVHVTPGYPLSFVLGLTCRLGQ